MRDKLLDYLLQRPAGASPQELLDLIFTQPGSDPELAPRFLQTLLGCDSRFFWRPDDGTWVARAHDVLARPLAATRFVVVDLETTGLRPSAHGIVEIGAIRIENGKIVDQFSQLVNPGVPLQPFIVRLTGICDAMLADQPRIDAVWPRFVEYLGDDVLLAHNAGYDMGYLNAAAFAFGGRPLPNSHLCSLKLARRLVPESRRRGLDALAGVFGIPLADRHRALGDARITAEVFFHLLERMAARGISRLDEAIELQHRARDGRPFVCFLPRDKVDQLPLRPGIYRFFAEDGRLLYVGKAKNLRQRVASYLGNAADHSDKTLDLIRHAHDVRVEVLGSELEAALEEAVAIRREQPPYNRLGKHLPRIAFLKLSLRDAFPRLSIARRLGAGQAQYIGPFRNRDEAESMLGLLTRLYRLRTCSGRLQPDPGFSPCLQGQVGACSEPCAARVTSIEYRRQVEACLALLVDTCPATEGALAAARLQLTRRRDELSAELRFEAAAKVQRDVDLLQRLERRQRTLGWISTRQNFLVLQPTADHRLVLAYGVIGGRLALRARLADASEINALVPQLMAELDEGKKRGLRPDDVDGTVILAAWLRDHGEKVGCVFRLDPPREQKKWPATQVDEWRAACTSLLTPVAD
ncbi:MAG: GIY-YIG nuclease family protein [Deltaproteobacteria bacterium]|nr:GIY-YIG nuclease family protein [Deltaproteobacteria bacterium]